MKSVYVYMLILLTTDRRRTTHRPLIWKWRYLSDGSSDPLHIWLKVGVSGSADRMALFPARSNSRWRLAAQPPSSKIQMVISPPQVIWSTSCLFLYRVGFSRSACRVLLLPVALNPRGGRWPSWKISNEYVSWIGYPIHFYEINSRFARIWATMVREE